MELKNTPLGQRLPVINWEYADETARLAATDFLATDKYKCAVQLDNNSIWMLVDTSTDEWIEITYIASQNFPTIELVGTVPSGAKTTTSATYAAIDGTVFDIVFNKLNGGTDLLITLSMALFSTAQPTTVVIGVDDGSNEHDVVSRDINAANAHIELSGVIKISGLPAGSVTLTPIWKRTGINGTITFQSASNAMLFMTVQEVAG